jgi:hypothetical protein
VSSPSELDDEDLAEFLEIEEPFMSKATEEEWSDMPETAYREQAVILDYYLVH